MINNDYIDYRAKLGFISGLCVGLSLSETNVAPEIEEELHKFGDIGIKHLFENIIDNPEALADASNFFDQLYEKYLV
jgi:hypothetical protein